MPKLQNPKIKIVSQAVNMFGGRFWKVSDGRGHYGVFTTFEAAKEHVDKKLKRSRKEASAYSMLQRISINLLSHKDAELVNKLLKTKCSGITPRQYGYLKGIHERQEREW